mgnify:CR=1 FL=1|tara:strand:- start:455 stop:1000 length:546 start_codon:yes stop_codon:yes gene_type:complete
MARIPLLSEEDLPEQISLVKKIKGRRRGHLINVYRALLHSPPLAESWFDHINQVRWGTKISGRLREIVIIRIGYLFSATYVLRQHIPVLANAEGLSETICVALKDWENTSCFNLSEQAALRYIDAMALEVRVPDEIFTSLQAHYSHRQIVELTLMTGAYISHTRVLIALEVDLEPDETANL